MTQRRILVTAALPYANGPIHIGHLVEYIQTDIWVRFQKLRGHRCIYVCADDTHGTAIMIRARQEGRSEEELIAEMQQAHLRDFEAFDVEFDNYGSTHSTENRRFCAEIWSGLRRQKLIVERDVSQLFDPDAGTFLADRFVRGKCPKCQAADQYGDNCDKCGATYSAVDLIDPVSTLSGAKPELRTQRHLFVVLEKLHDFLDKWTREDDHLQAEVTNYLHGHFLHEPLRDWDISRPAPYFGFEIPDSPGNFWYVWFDAPIGYIASTKDWCVRHAERFDDWWRSDATEIHHFIGKDITYFHTLFWPGMLKSADFSLPTKVHIHGFLTVGGEKMSKTKGTFIMAETFRRHLNPAYLRYYYASKLGSRLDDLDLNFDEFVDKVNADLVGKVVNLASRCARFVEGTGLASCYPDDGGLFQQAADAGDAIADAYEQCDYNKAMRLIMGLADKANPYVEVAEPWKLAKDPQQLERLCEVCTVALNLFRQIVVYLSPVLPELADQTSRLLNCRIRNWDDAKTPLVGTPVAKFEHMMKRVSQKEVQKMIDESKETLSAEPSSEVVAATDSDQPLKDEPLAEECTFDEFVKVDLRVARIISADDVTEARKLLKLTLSLGGEEHRTVFAGIKQAYDPKELVGRLVVLAANLAPRKMKFGTSEGMILASGKGGSEVFLLAPDKGAEPGQRVH